MGFVIANAYSSFLLPKKKKLPCRAAAKGVLLKPKIIFSSLYNLGDRKNSSTKRNRATATARKTVVMITMINIGIKSAGTKLHRV